MLSDLFDFFLINGDTGDHESADNSSSVRPSNKSSEEESHQANVTLLL